MYKKYIIPDLHGDFNQLCNILHTIGILPINTIEVIRKILLENDYSYINLTNKKIIQLGDILDSKTRIFVKNDIGYNDMLIFIFLCKLKKEFPNNVVLIYGNHEFLNYNKIYAYLSKKSSRSEKEHNYICNSIRTLFQYYYIDEERNLYIHSSIPENVVSEKTLKYYELQLKKTNYTINEIYILYDIVFTRDPPSQLLLNLLNIKNVFFGHTPHDDITVINNNIYYTDVFISNCFDYKNTSYNILMLNNGKITKINIKRKSKYQYHKICNVQNESY